MSLAVADGYISPLVWEPPAGVGHSRRRGLIAKDAPRVILHIGRSKTGSTAVQRALSRNRESLSAQGYTYPGIGLDHAEVVYALAGDRSAEWCANKISREIRTADNSVILSSEGFENVEPALVREWLDGLDVRVVVYLREQAAALSSAYQQYVKGELESETFEVFASRYHIDYHEFVEGWARVFGRANMIARTYDGDSDVVEDFLWILGVDDAATYRVDEPDPNPSVAGALLEAKRRLNSIFKGTAASLRDITYQAILDLTVEHKNYRGGISTSELFVEDVRRLHRNSNERLARTYFGRQTAFRERPLQSAARFTEADVLEAWERMCGKAPELRVLDTAWRGVGPHDGSNAKVGVPKTPAREIASMALQRGRPPGTRLVEAGYPAIDLPDVSSRVQLGTVRGRCPSHGYQRGWGLEFHGLADQIAAHPLYLEALSASRQRSIVDVHRLMNLFLIVACYFDTIEDHNIVEFGSYRGGSALFVAHLLKQLWPEASIWAHDTFQGMPETDTGADLHTQGDFLDADLVGFERAKAESGFDRLHIVQGLVQDTFPSQDQQLVRFGLAHFDMDIYEPTAFGQQAAWPHMTPGGYFVYDDATVSSCIGATQAVEELVRVRGLHSEQVYPHFVFRVGLS